MARRNRDTIAGDATTSARIDTDGRPGRGRIDDTADRDWWEVELRAGDSYWFTANPVDGVNTALTLRDATGAEVPAVIQSFLTVTYLYVTAPGSGTYFLDVGTDRDGSGRYSISAREVPAAANTWTEVGLTGELTGLLHEARDSDWHAIEFVAGHSYHLMLRGASSDGGTLADPRLVLRGPDGTVIARDNDGGPGQDAYLVFTAAVSGTYYLQASSAAGAGSYSIAARSAHADEAASDATTTALLALSHFPSGTASAAGLIGRRNDHDWYAVTLHEGEVYRMTAEAMQERFGLATSLVLRDGEGEALAFGAQGEADQEIVFRAAETGTYFLDVGGDGRSTGAYLLRVEETPAGTDTHLRLTPGLSRTGNIEAEGDRDWFATTLETGITYDLAVSGGTLGRAVLTLRGADGAPVQTTAPGEAGFAFTPEAGGTYYLEVAAAPGGAGGSYTVSAGLPPSDGFDILLDYVGDPALRPVFAAAEARWEAIITGDLPDVADAEFGLIDDLVIFASVAAIDGAGGILGQAIWEARRDAAEGGLPHRGFMRFDAEDLGMLVADGTLEAVILHEMGHVLGLEGTLWGLSGLVEDGMRYTGAAALAEYRLLAGDPGLGFVPLEDEGGGGTAGMHWDEERFGNELMTGYLNGGQPNPLSRLTIASLQDLGYGVAYDGAEPYALPAPALSSSAPAALHLAATEAASLIL
jgi:hypothetical protein